MRGNLRGRRRQRAQSAAARLAAVATLSWAVSLGGCGGSGHREPPRPLAGTARAGATTVAAGARTPAAAAAGEPAPSGRPAALAVGLRVVRIVDPSRSVRLPDGRSQARTLVTYVRYPALGRAGASELRDAPPAAGRFPLIVFGHGFAVTPGTYSRLLLAWARAGFVVAAPVFPLGNADAPGGPDESDLVNQPADMSLVIGALLAGRDGTRALAGAIDPRRIAVAGQSDGGDTALAVAYDPRFRDRRVDAAVILSGAEIPGVGALAFPSRGPPLLAVQGTADTINPPELTDAFFAAAPRPKFLLRLLGAGHLPPYTAQQPQLAVVERVTLAFLRAYLQQAPAARAQLARYGSLAGTATLLREP